MSVPSVLEILVIFLVHYSYKFSFSVCISVLHFHLKKVSFYNNFGIVQQHTVPRLTHSYYKAGSQISQPITLSCQKLDYTLANCCHLNCNLSIIWLEIILHYISLLCFNITVTVSSLFVFRNQLHFLFHC